MRCWKNRGRYKNRGNIKLAVGHPNKDEAKSSQDKYDNNIEDGNGAKDEYNNDMGMTSTAMSMCAQAWNKK